MTTATVAFTDFSNEDSATQFPTIDMSAVDYVAARQAIDNMIPLIEALSNGTLRSVSILDEVLRYNDPNPVVPTAQREIKAKVAYADSVNNRRYSMTIPVFNYDGVVANTDIIDTTLGAWPAFIAGLEANVLSVDQNPVTFLSAVLVGRNL